jgi:hypothetical protein
MNENLIVFAQRDCAIFFGKWRLAANDEWAD